MNYFIAIGTVKNHPETVYNLRTVILETKNGEILISIPVRYTVKKGDKLVVEGYLTIEGLSNIAKVERLQFIKEGGERYAKTNHSRSSVS